MAPTEKIASDLAIDKFEYGNNFADFDSWVKLFEFSIVACTGASKTEPERVQALCLIWIPLKLNTAAFALYEALSGDKKKEWTTLKQTLSKKFDDPQTRMRYISCVDAYKRNASDSLTIYKAEVIRLVKKYYKSMKEDEESFKEQAYIRFLKGLPNNF